MSAITSSSEAVAISAYEASIRDSAETNVLLKLATRRLFRDHGLVTVAENEDGPIEVLDGDAIKEKMFDTFSVAVVVSKKDRDEVPVHRIALTGAVLDKLPVPPSDEWDALDAITRQAWHEADSYIWKSVQHTYSHKLQRWVRERLGEGMTLVKTADTVFVTAEPKYIRSEIFVPETDKVEIIAAKVGGVLGKFASHNPALRSGAARLLNASTERAGEKATAAFLLANRDDDEE